MSNLGDSDLTERVHAQLRAGFAQLQARNDDRWPVVERSRTVRPRQLVSDNDPDGGFWFIVLNDGWAIRFRLLPDGRRQILQFLIPGDFINARRLIAASDQEVVQTVTECSLQEYRGEAAAEIARADVDLLSDLVRYHVAEITRLEARLVDLGRRFAEERIAGLVLELHERLGARGLTSDQSFYLPVRQEHVADALGMTPVHVSRTLRSLRDSDTLQIEQGMLRIKNYDRLVSIAGL